MSARDRNRSDAPAAAPHAPSAAGHAPLQSAADQPAATAKSAKADAEPATTLQPPSSQRPHLREQTQPSDPARPTGEIDAASAVASAAVVRAAAAAGLPSLKKCSRCGCGQPVSAFSGAQLRLGGRRQCRDCVDPICGLCGQRAVVGSVLAPASAAEWQLRSLLVRRAPPAADVQLLSHFACAKMLKGVITMAPDGDSATVNGVVAGLVDLIAGRCSDCGQRGGVRQCGGCGRVYHSLCGGGGGVAAMKGVAWTYPSGSKQCSRCAQPEPSSDDHLHSGDSAPGAAADFVSSIEPSSTSTVAAASATAQSSSCPSAPAAMPAALKKCSLCQSSQPESGYSSTQLKAKAKRQCKSCMVALQAAQTRLPPSEALVVPQNVGQRLDAAASWLNSSSESAQQQGVICLYELLDGCETAGIHLHLEAKVVSPVLTLMRDSPNGVLREISLVCTIFMRRQSQLTALLVAAGAIPAALTFLSRADLQQTHFVEGVALLRRIAEASRVHCDALLDAGALAVLLPLVQPDISAGLLKMLIPALDLLLHRRPAAEVASAVVHLVAVLMDGATAPEILRACLNTLGDAFIGVACGDSNAESWAESILTAAPGFPQRLVDLLGDRERPDVVAAALSLVTNMFRANTDRLRQLFDCGLLDKLSPLLSGAGGEPARLRAAVLCTNAAQTKDHALTLLDSAPIVERLLALLVTVEGEPLRHVAGFFLNLMYHRNRRITRRLVDDYRFLPPLVAAFRRVTASGDQTATLGCLAILANVLVVGEAEAGDDDRGVNPYNEPIDWLGAFEIVDPLQKHADAELAKLATRVFSYFIPNDCD